MKPQYLIDLLPYLQCIWWSDVIQQRSLQQAKVMSCDGRRRPFGTYLIVKFCLQTEYTDIYIKSI